MGPLTQGRGKWSNSHFLIFALVASIPSSWLLAQKQLVTSPISGSGQGSTTLTMSPFPHLSQPQQLTWHSLGQWVPLTLHFGAAGPFIACLLRGAEGLPGIWLCSRPASSELGVLQDVAWRKRGLPCLGTKARDKQPVPCSHGGGIIGIYLCITLYGVMPRPWGG